MVYSRVSHEAMDFAETIANLACLIRTKPPALCQTQACQIEERALALGHFLRSVSKSGRKPVASLRSWLLSCYALIVDAD